MGCKTNKQREACVLDHRGSRTEKKYLEKWLPSFASPGPTNSLTRIFMKTVHTRSDPQGARMIHQRKIENCSKAMVFNWLLGTL